MSSPTGTVRRLVKLVATAMLLMAASGSRQARASDVLLAAASDLNFVLKELISGFEHQTGHHVKLSLGSSGNLYAQLRNGAPFDLFLSADGAHARELEKAGLAEPGSTFVYGYGQIVLWVRKDSPLDIEKPGLDLLADPAVRKIAVANPTHAPYGRAAVAALRHFKVYDRVRAKLVYGESVLQAAQFVETGAADIGIIARSLAGSPAMLQSGRHRLIAPESHPKLEQAGVLLRSARRRGTLAAARALADLIRGPSGRSLLERYGYSMPPEPSAAPRPTR